jgi:predicted transcriptional regulator of viral defense system
MLDANDKTPLDGVIASVAERQHGVIALHQLVTLGLSASAVRSRVATGRLHRVHRAVFAVGRGGLTHRGRIAAAVLACRPGTAASHRTVAALLDLRIRTRPWIDVTAPCSTARRRDGFRIHSGATLTAADVTLIDNIPCTTLARTLLDVADDATRREVERACDQADTQRLLDMHAIDEVLTRADGRRGAVLLRSVLAEHRAGTTLTRSELEERFLAIAREAGLPPDAVNFWIPFREGDGAEADFVWHHQRLIVEVDGRDVHTTRRAFDADRRRDQRLMLLGFRVVRFTWRQVSFDARYVAATLRGLLS